MPFLRRQSRRLKGASLNRLPLEIRDMIWNLAADGNPRVLRAKWKRDTNGHNKAAVYHLIGGEVPAILHVNRESRKVALKKYSCVQAYLPIRRPPTTHVHRDVYVYINLAVETIYVTKMPERRGFQFWLRRLVRTKRQFKFKDKVAVAGKCDTGGIRHLAFDVPKGVHRVCERDVLETKTALAYLLCLDHMNIASFTFIIDRSTYTKDNPARYRISDLCGKDLGPNRSFPASYAHKCMDNLELGAFRGRTDHEVRYKTMREANPDWEFPEMRLMTIVDKRADSV